jgi:hypothetical protein
MALTRSSTLASPETSTAPGPRRFFAARMAARERWKQGPSINDVRSRSSVLSGPSPSPDLTRSGCSARRTAKSSAKAPEGSASPCHSSPSVMASGTTGRSPSEFARQGRLERSCTARRSSL